MILTQIEKKKGTMPWWYCIMCFWGLQVYTSLVLSFIPCIKYTGSNFPQHQRLRFLMYIHSFLRYLYQWMHVSKVTNEELCQQVKKIAGNSSKSSREQFWNEMFWVDISPQITLNHLLQSVCIMPLKKHQLMKSIKLKMLWPKFFKIVLLYFFLL